MSLAPITEEQRKCVRKDINLDDAQLEKKVQMVKDWMKKQPHLPEVPDNIIDKIIRSFLIGTKMSTETTKHKIDTYYAMRHQLPDIFLGTGRDPCTKDVRDSVDIVRFFTLPEMTPDGIRVTFTCFSKDKKFTGQDLLANYKRIVAITESRIQQGDFTRGEYLVYDLRGLYLSHIKDLPWLQIQRFTAMIQEGFPLRIKGIFFFYAPSYLETILNILKPALKEKIRKRMHVYQGDHTTLYEHIPRRILPSDFGGEAPSSEELSRAWQKTIESMRDFLLEDGKRATDESKRPKDSVIECGQMFGINGTFNKLTLD